MRFSLVAVLFSFLPYAICVAFSLKKLRKGENENVITCVTIITFTFIPS